MNRRSLLKGLLTGAARPLIGRVEAPKAAEPTPEPKLDFEALRMMANEHAKGWQARINVTGVPYMAEDP